MKRTMLVMLCLMLCFVLVGCDTMATVRKGLTTARQALESIELQVGGNIGGGLAFPQVPVAEPEIEPPEVEGGTVENIE